jgi:protein-tyrosine phosphatase
MKGPEKEIGQRLGSLEEHLRQENPLLVDAVKSFRRLDRIAYKMGFLSRDQTYATQIAWWPLISVLGTFSAGKSTFINHYLNYPLQPTGAQAVDEKFTVICYTTERETQVLPGIALNADPRFPFYRMSEELEKVQPGEGVRIDSYLQLKTCTSEYLRGQIFIDSPGFDADAQRTATLRITDYIIDLSDLVLVFFDARHPEPGAMKDALKHLVANTINRSDSSKFMYILNQIDTSARENNPEEVIAAWQRTIAQEGLTAGKFYCIYNPDAATPIQDEAVRKRFEAKRDKDMAEIHSRIRQVGLERAYRIVGALEKTARELQEQKVTRLKEIMRRWRRGVLWRDATMFGVVVCGYIAVGLWAGYLTWREYLPPQLKGVVTSRWLQPMVIAVVLSIFVCLHFLARKWAAQSVLKFLKHSILPGSGREIFNRAFLKNKRPWRSIFSPRPVGWGLRARRKVKEIIADAGGYVQRLNDQFARPSGEPGESSTLLSGNPAYNTMSRETGLFPGKGTEDDRLNPVEPKAGKRDISSNIKVQNDKFSYPLRWITEDLAVGYAPKSIDDLAVIKDQGIGAIMNLCAECYDLQEIEERNGFEVYYLPVQDQGAPEIAETEKAFAWIDKHLPSGHKVLVHCRYGIGRTGTFVAAYLLKKGLSLEDALEKIKHTPSAPSSRSQWDFLKQYGDQLGVMIHRPETQEDFYRDNFFEKYEAMKRWFGSHKSGLDRDIN